MYLSAILRYNVKTVFFDNQNAITQETEIFSTNCFIVFLFTFQERQLAVLLGEDYELTERRQQCAKRLELYRSARDEIEAVCWSG